MIRPQDERVYDRTERAVLLRIGTVHTVNASTLDVDVPGGTLTGVPQLSTFTATVGQTVAVLMDSVRALVIGPLK